MPGIRVGDGLIIATKSVFARDVGAHTSLAGNPAKENPFAFCTIIQGIFLEIPVRIGEIEENYSVPKAILWRRYIML